MAESANGGMETLKDIRPDLGNADNGTGQPLFPVMSQRCGTLAVEKACSPSKLMTVALRETL